MKFGRGLTTLSVAAAAAIPACSSSSSSKRSADGGDTEVVVYGGASGTGATGGTGMVTYGGAAGVGGSGGSSGGSGAGGGGGAATDCATLCEVITGANCPNGETREQCLADCGTVIGECPAQLGAFAGCLSTTGSVVCDSAGDPTISGCDDSWIGLSGCSACLPSSGDDACFRCQQTNCCSQTKAYFGSADVFEFTECISACTTTTCISSCERSFPIAGGAFNRLSQCVTASCTTACSGS